MMISPIGLVISILQDELEDLQKKMEKRRNDTMRPTKL